MNKKYSVTIIIPDMPYKNIKEMVSSFSGTIVDIMSWDHDGENAECVWFESETTDLAVRLNNALIRGYIWSFSIRIAKAEEVKQKDKSEREKERQREGWKEILTDNLHKTVFNSETKEIVSIEYDGNFTFSLKRECWETFEKLSDVQVDEKLAKMGIDPEKGWK